MKLAEFINKHPNVRTTEEIKTALVQCTAPQLCELIQDTDLKMLNFLTDALALFITKSPEFNKGNIIEKDRRYIN